mgnify:CR=1 FL=1
MKSLIAETIFWLLGVNNCRIILRLRESLMLISYMIKLFLEEKQFKSESKWKWNYKLSRRDKFNKFEMCLDYKKEDSNQTWSRDNKSSALWKLKITDFSLNTRTSKENWESPLNWIKALKNRVNVKPLSKHKSDSRKIFTMY